MKTVNIEYVTHDRLPFFRYAAAMLEDARTILDAGAGDDGFAAVTGRDDIHLLDNNPVNVEGLRKTRRNVRYGSITAMPYGNNSFNGIHCSHVVEHLTPDEVYLFMKEVERCIKRKGLLVISAPLMWAGFYNDLSHTRPYPPEVFINYLCGSAVPRTREVINGFEQVDLIYRSLWMGDGDPDVEKPKLFTKTGYTLVLRKI